MAKCQLEYAQSSTRQSEQIVVPQSAHIPTAGWLITRNGIGSISAPTTLAGLVRQEVTLVALVLNGLPQAGMGYVVVIALTAE